jgi:hypothetical protein
MYSILLFPFFLQLLHRFPNIFRGMHKLIQLPKLLLRHLHGLHERNGGSYTERHFTFSNTVASIFTPLKFAASEAGAGSWSR